ncbi:clathrin interactor EPSIN 2-like isoform X2 [Aristolochia californica]|uniref:clathrin interactor EPSIN 2-like isoform X2 n=1 Tax=Aristolochia californica TaxID=171875 RepID=UPI0035DD1831
MKKAIGQTVRDIKREVNKKVLKVPGIEQKVLDATSNEPWGPHGSHLADIAQATRNYNEYQLIMVVIWKRINDAGKNWRHVYKALTVLEYLVAHGSERVIDDIREHAYQISTLSDFQYIDSSGRDQGSNVRKKSQSLVVLVNDKERIQEVRQKALANRDKFRTPSAGGMYRPSSYSGTGGGYGDRYDDDRYGEDRNGYGRDREWGHCDDDRYGRGGDRYGRDGDERYGRDGYRDEDYRGSRGNDEYGSRNKNYDRDRDRYDDDDKYSSRSGGGRADDQSPDERRFERKLSQQSISAPPSYEEAVNGTPGHNQDERDGVPAPKTSSPSKSFPPAPKASSPSLSSPSGASPLNSVADETTSSMNKEAEGFDEFDPRASALDMNTLALIPVTSAASTSEAGAAAGSDFVSNFVPLSSASTVLNQPSEDPFGDGPFKAVPSDDSFGAQAQNFAPPDPAAAATVESVPDQSGRATISNFEFADTLQGIMYVPTVSDPNPQVPTQSSQPQQQPLPAQSSNDILGGILPQTVSLAAGVSPMPYQVPSSSGSPFGDAAPPPPLPTGQSGPGLVYGSSAKLPAAAAGHFGIVTPYGASGPTAGITGHFRPGAPYGSSGPFAAATVGHLGSVAPYVSLAPPPSLNGPFGSATPFGSSAPPQAPMGQLPSIPLAASYAPSDPTSQFGPRTVMASHAPTPAPTTPVSQQLSSSQQPSTIQQSKDKFETKSTVWADTLSRGLVNLNISGPKTNPLADIGIDFDTINRQEKRREKEKNSTSSITSTITMGKAMGSGSGIGRTGASVLVPHPNPMMGGGMGMGMVGGPGIGMGGPGRGVGMGMGMGMGGYGGGMNQPMGGMGMGMGQGAPMRPPSGPGIPGVYNPMMSMGGGYGSQQPYGGYRSG